MDKLQKGIIGRISGQRRNGNIIIRNLGGFIEGFGKNKPVGLYFTPITIDNFADDINEAGGCVDLNPDAAFPHCFILNQLTLLRVRTGSTMRDVQDRLLLEGVCLNSIQMNVLPLRLSKKMIHRLRGLQKPPVPIVIRPCI